MSRIIETRPNPESVIDQCVMTFKTEEQWSWKDPVKRQAHIDCARRRSAILASLSSDEIGAVIHRRARHPITASDNSSATLGILTGTAIATKALEMFHYERNGLFGRITTEFGDTPVSLGQTLDTRVVSSAAVKVYDPTIGADGYQRGWRSITQPQTVSADTIASAHIGVPIRFNTNDLAATPRNLIQEQGPAVSAALADYIAEQMLYPLMTPANFNAYAIVNPPTVPTAYVTLAIGLANFARSSLATVNGIFTPNKVPLNNRSVLLNSAYFGKLNVDPSVMQIASGTAASEEILDTQLPKMATFLPIEAPDLATANATPNLCGFFMHRAALVLRTGPPTSLNDILKGVTLGRTVIVTDDRFGFSGLLVEYIDHTYGFSEWRLEIVATGGVGDTRGGLCLTTQ